MVSRRQIDGFSAGPFRRAPGHPVLCQKSAGRCFRPGDSHKELCDVDFCCDLTARQGYFEAGFESAIAGFLSVYFEGRPGVLCGFFSWHCITETGDRPGKMQGCLFRGIFLSLVGRVSGRIAIVVVEKATQARPSFEVPLLPPTFLSASMMRLPNP